MCGDEPTFKGMIGELYRPSAVDIQRSSFGSSVSRRRRGSGTAFRTTTSGTLVDGSFMTSSRVRTDPDPGTDADADRDPGPEPDVNSAPVTGEEELPSPLLITLGLATALGLLLPLPFPLPLCSAAASMLEALAAPAMVPIAM